MRIIYTIWLDYLETSPQFDSWCEHWGLTHSTGQRILKAYINRDGK